MNNPVTSSASASKPSFFCSCDPVSRHELVWIGFTATLIGTLHFLLYKVFDLCLALSGDHMQWDFAVYSQFKTALARGELPFWQPEIFAGFPLLFSGTIDFKMLLLVPFFEPLDAMLIHASLYIAFTLTGFYWFARELFVVRRGTAFLTALLWTFNAYFCARYYDIVFNTAFVWTPVLAAAVVHFGKRPRLHFTLLTLGTLDQVQVARWDSLEIGWLTLWLFLAAYLLFWQDGALKGRLRRLARVYATLAVSITLACLIAMPLLWEQVDLMRNAERYLNSIEGSQFAPSWVNLFSLIPFSEKFTTIGSGASFAGFFGAFALLAFLLGATAHRRTLIFGLLGGVIVLLLYDVRIFGFNLFLDGYRALPKHDTVRYSERFLPAFYFFFSIPILFGVETLSKRSWPKLCFALGSLLIVAGALAGYLLLTRVAPEQWGTIFSWPRLSLLLLLAQTALIGCSLFFNSRIIIPIATLIAAQSYIVNWMSNDGEKPAYYRDYMYGEAVHLDRPLPPLDGQLYRISRLTVNSQTFPHQQHFIAKGYQSLTGYHALFGADLGQFVREVLGGRTARGFESDHADLRAYYLTNVRFWIHVENVRPQTKVPSDMFHPYAKGPVPGYVVDEANEFLPRYYFVEKARKMPGEQVIPAINQQIKDDFHWFSKNVIITESDPQRVIKTKAPSALNNPVRIGPMDDAELGYLASNGAISLVRATGSAVELQIQAAQSGFLVALDRFDSFRWRAQLDGIEVPIERANGLFRAIAISAGKHRVYFYYVLAPWTLLFSLVGVLLAIVTSSLCVRFRTDS